MVIVDGLQAEGILIDVWLVKDKQETTYNHMERNDILNRYASHKTVCFNTVQKTCGFIFKTIATTMDNIGFPLKIKDVMRDFECAFRNAIDKHIVLDGFFSHGCGFHMFQANDKKIGKIGLKIYNGLKNIYNL